MKRMGGWPFNLAFVLFLLSGLGLLLVGTERPSKWLLLLSLLFIAAAYVMGVLVGNKSKRR